MRIPTSGLAGFAVVLVLALWGACRSVEAQEGSTYKIVAFTGQPAPDGGTFFGFNAPTIGADGTIGFVGKDSSRTNFSVFAGPPGSLRLVAATGENAPGTGTPSDTFYNFSTVSVGQDGRVAFNAEISRSQLNIPGIWAETSNGLAIAAFAGSVDPNNLSTSDLGVAAFRSDSLGTKAELSPDDSFSALLFGAPGALSAVLEDGQSLGTSQVTTIFDSGDSELSVGPYVDVNESGKVALKIGVSASASPTPGPTPPPVQAIYAGSPSAPVPVAIQNDSVPGMSGFTYSEFMQDPTISSNDQVAFCAYLNPSAGLGTSAVFAGLPGAVAPVVLSGSTVPTTTDVTFGNFNDAVVNAAGDVIFTAGINYPNEGSRSGIWLKRSTGPAVLIAVDGMNLPTPSGTGEVSAVGLAGPGSFNDLYEVVFQAWFTDGSQGIYVADTRPGAPTISIVAPAKPRDRVTMASKIVFAGTASDDTGVAKVEYTVAHEVSASKRSDGKHHSRFITSRVKLAKGATNWKFDVPLTMGLNLISVTATDKLGNQSPAYKIRVLRYACPAN